MFVRLLLLFTVVPAIELFLLLQIGAWLGPTTTFLLILLTGLVGATLAKREGISVLRDLQGELAKGLPPGSRIVEGVLVLVGGLLLITPGVFTDLVGVLLIVPPTRKFLAPRVLEVLKGRIDVRVGGAEAAWHQAPPAQRPTPTPFSSPFDD